MNFYLYMEHRARFELAVLGICSPLHWASLPPVLVAWPYANNVVFVCDMRYFWQSDVLHFHISSSNGVKNNDFSSHTHTHAKKKHIS